MTFSINTFRAKGLPKGGARPSLFSVDIIFPFVTAYQDRARFLCRSATIPIMPLDTIRIPYMGRSIKVVGDREFPDWTVRVMNDEDFPLRVAFEKWSSMMNRLEENRMDPAMFPLGYKSRALVRQYSKAGTDDKPLREYVLEGIFPVNVDAMVVDWDAQNQIQEYDVTFAFDYWLPSHDNGGGNTDAGSFGEFSDQT